MSRLVEVHDDNRMGLVASIIEGASMLQVYSKREKKHKLKISRELMELLSITELEQIASDFEFMADDQVYLAVETGDSN